MTASLTFSTFSPPLSLRKPFSTFIIMINKVKFPLVIAEAMLRILPLLIIINLKPSLRYLIIRYAVESILSRTSAIIEVKSRSTLP
jgi:hypothetical protein